MSDAFSVTVDGWAHSDPIPGNFAFCVPADEGYVTMGENLNPAVRWTGAPEGTRSFAIVCVDPDVPSKPDDVNQEGRTVPAGLPRIDFYHWVLVDIPVTVTEIAEGADSRGITAGGKAAGPASTGVRGINSYTDWFAGQEDMAGDYGGYDGPCPPWHDEIIHHYHFTVYALDVPSLGLPDRFGGAEAVEAVKRHVLAEATWTGTYTLNRNL